MTDETQTFDITPTWTAAMHVQTPRFKAWFGDSKAVDADGKPLVVYHGSPEKFEEFSEAEQRDPGFWFTSDKRNAQNYTGEAGSFVEAHLNVQRPAVFGFDYAEQTLTFEGAPFDGDNVEAVRFARGRGYDSVNFPRGNLSETGNTWVVFEPTQIKSVTYQWTFTS